MVTKTVTYSSGYTIVKFTGSGSDTYSIPDNTTVEYLLAGGGGAGGSGSSDCYGGGGGGGQVVTDTTTLSGTLSIVVGWGGTPTTGVGGRGGASSLNAVTADGGFGGDDPRNAWGGVVGVGGSAGGIIAATSYAGGDRFPMSAGGGGGYGSNGASPGSSEYGGAGGAGIASAISGTSLYYGMGGGGCGVIEGGAGGSGTTGGHGFNVLSAGGQTDGIDGYGGGGGGGDTGTPPPEEEEEGVFYLTDYGIVADGSDETAALIDALTTAADQGYIKVAFPTTMTIGVNDYIETPENLEFVGNNCTIKLIDDSTIDHDMGFFYIHEGCYVHNLIFDGNQAGQVINPDAVNGVMLYSNVIFSSNEVKNVGAYSIEVYYSTDVTVTYNYIHDSWQYGCAFTGSEGDTFYTENCNCSYNTFENIGELAVKLRWAQDIEVSYNDIVVSDEAGIGICFSADGPTIGCNIHHNIIDAPATNARGIYAVGGGHSAHEISYNTLSSADLAGIDVGVTDSTISNNVISYYSNCISNDSTTNTLTDNTCNAL